MAVTLSIHCSGTRRNTRMTEIHQIPVTALAEPAGLKRLGGTSWNRVDYEIARPVSLSMSKGVFAGCVNGDGRVGFVESHITAEPSLS